MSNSLLWKCRPNGLYCFNYHRIGDPEKSKFDPNVFSCDERTFEEHLRFYKENFDILTINELNELQKSRKKLVKKYALITFDDGYVDNYELAYPLLKKHKIPATFFIATDFIEKEKLPWWDEIAFLLKNCNQKTLQLENWKTPINLDRTAKNSNIKEVLQRIKADSSKQMDEKILSLKKVLNLPPNYTPPHKDLFMNWDMLKDMEKNGMTIGSQSCSHRIMSHLSIQEQFNEASNSKIILSRQLKNNIVCFAYPVGGNSSFTKVTEDILRKLKYTFGFSFVSGINRTINNHCFHLKRFSVDSNCSNEQLKKQINKAILTRL